MLKKFNKMLADEFFNQGFINTYLVVLFITSILNVYGFIKGEEYLSLFELLVGGVLFVLLMFFIIVLIKFVYSIIKEKINKK